MNTGKFRIRKLSILLMILPFSVLYSNPQHCLYNHEVEMPNFVSDSFSMGGNYGSCVYLQIDSGADWRNITIEMSSYIYGVTRFKNLNFSDPTELFPAVHFHKASSGISLIEPISLSMLFKSISQSGRSPAVTVYFSVRITGTVTLHIKNIGGKNSVTVSKGRIIKRFYNLKVDAIDFSGSIYCCESENDKGPMYNIVGLYTDVG